MKQNFTRPDGFMDVDPDQLRRRAFVEKQLLDVFALHGFTPVDVPSLEYGELYDRARVGDQRFHQLYLTRVAAASNHAQSRDAILRPEMTAPVVRYWVSQGLEGVPLAAQRLAFAGQVFRERSGNRAREFREVGVEWVGASGPWADLEVLETATAAARALHPGPWTLQVGDVGILPAMLAHFGVPEGSLEAIGRDVGRAVRVAVLADRWPDDAADLMDAMGPRLRRAGLTLPSSTENFLPTYLDYLGQHWRRSHQLETRTVEKILPWISRVESPSTLLEALIDELPQEIIGPIAERMRWTLAQLGARPGIELTMTVAARQDLNYYSGLTFWLHAPFMAGVGAGGRYDELVRWICAQANLNAGPEAAAVGMTFYVDALAPHVTVPDRKPPVRLLANPKTLGMTMGVARRLRKQGIDVGVHEGDDNGWLVLDPETVRVGTQDIPIEEAARRWLETS